MKPSMFIKIDGIKGESEDTEHEAWIDILSWSWGGTQAAQAQVGRGRAVARAQMQDLSFVKFVDRSTPGLFYNLHSGRHIAKAELHCTKATGNDRGGDLSYIVIKLEDVIVTSVSTGGSSGEARMTENVSLGFAKIEYQYTVQGDDGGSGDKPAVWMDLARGTSEIA